MFDCNKRLMAKPTKRKRGVFLIFFAESSQNFFSKRLSGCGSTETRSSPCGTASLKVHAVKLPVVVDIRMLEYANMKEDV